MLTVSLQSPLVSFPVFIISRKAHTLKPFCWMESWEMKSSSSTQFSSTLMAMHSFFSRYSTCGVRVAHLKRCCSTFSMWCGHKYHILALALTQSETFFTKTITLNLVAHLASAPDHVLPSTKKDYSLFLEDGKLIQNLNQIWHSSRSELQPSPAGLLCLVLAWVSAHTKWHQSCGEKLSAGRLLTT